MPSGRAVGNCPHCGDSHPPGAKCRPSADRPSQDSPREPLRESHEQRRGWAYPPSSSDLHRREPASETGNAAGARQEGCAASVFHRGQTERGAGRGFPFGHVLEGGYRIIRHIAEGGMGAVYEAETTATGERVAVKAVHRALLSNDEVVARFLKEAQAVSALRHEHIVSASHMARTSDGSLFFVMELLVGSDLGHLLAETGGRLRYGRAAHIVSQVLSALEAAHVNSIIHRDLKPENIFLVRHGDDPDFVKVLDFGVSKCVAGNDASQLTAAGYVLGTPHYMAPEHARGAPYDHRIDIYSCGVILYQLVTGRLPFMAPTREALFAEIVSGRYLPPRALAPEIPPDFELVIQWAMALDPNARYQSAEHLRRALLPFAADARQVSTTGSGARAVVVTKDTERGASSANNATGGGSALAAGAGENRVRGEQCHDSTNAEIAQDDGDKTVVAELPPFVRTPCWRWLVPIVIGLVFLACVVLAYLCGAGWF
ncbi:MAG: serine/threonine-protein kinase [Pseudomonadota bacterium]